MRLKCCILTPMLMPMLDAIELDGARGRRDELVGWTSRFACDDDDGCACDGREACLRSADGPPSRWRLAICDSMMVRRWEDGRWW